MTARSAPRVCCCRRRSEDADPAAAGRKKERHQTGMRRDAVRCARWTAGTTARRCVQATGVRSSRSSVVRWPRGESRQFSWRPDAWLVGPHVPAGKDPSLAPVSYHVLHQRRIDVALHRSGCGGCRGRAGTDAWLRASLAVADATPLARGFAIAGRDDHHTGGGLAVIRTPVTSGLDPPQRNR